jgi:hypothetical protein
VNLDASIYLLQPRRALEDTVRGGYMELILSDAEEARHLHRRIQASRVRGAEHLQGVLIRREGRVLYMTTDPEKMPRAAEAVARGRRKRRRRRPESPSKP